MKIPFEWINANIEVIRKMKEDMKNSEADPILCVAVLQAIDLYQREHNGEGCPDDRLQEYVEKVVRSEVN